MGRLMRGIIDEITGRKRVYIAVRKCSECQKTEILEEAVKFYNTESYNRNQRVIGRIIRMFGYKRSPPTYIRAIADVLELKTGKEPFISY